jgi:hypothetical protein
VAKGEYLDPETDVLLRQIEGMIVEKGMKAGREFKEGGSILRG